MVKGYLSDYLKRNNILCDCQFRLCKVKNINDTPYEIIKQINLSLTNNIRSLFIFLDLEKAFDSVVREKLLAKLERIGAQGNALAWFGSYLTRYSKDYIF